MLGVFSIFTPAGAKLTILEVHPLLLPSGNFTLDLAWSNFTTSFFISFISLGMLVYAAIKERSADITLFLVWSIIMLLAVLGQRRFSYYFAINAALLTGYFSWRILDFAGLSKLRAVSKEMAKVTKKFKKRKKTKAREKPLPRPRAAWVKVIIAGIAIFFLVFSPNIDKAESLAKNRPLINQAWYSSVEWLKDNSPEPFGDPDFYYALYPPKSSFEYPETAYGVMSWWDYGHWIMRIGRRIPNASPAGQINAAEAARFLTAQDESSANQTRGVLGSKYVMIDSDMSTSKFYAFPRWTGSSEGEFFGVYYQPTEEGQLQRVNVFYPGYYRSMVARLYNFDGKAVVPTETIVISYEEKVSREGPTYKEITGSWSFPTYEEAEAYISSQESGNYRIVGPNPFVSPVPLEELTSYELVYESEARVNIADKSLPRVKIFEYIEGE
jgi:dolichyl-diphosphooligosaccharide--protein glycosyltransferase